MILVVVYIGHEIFHPEPASIYQVLREVLNSHIIEDLQKKCGAPLLLHPSACADRMGPKWNISLNKGIRIFS